MKKKLLNKLDLEQNNTLTINITQEKTSEVINELKTQ